MNVTQNRVADKLTVELEGRLDTTTAPALEGELASILGGVSEFVIDMTKLEYISSAGLRVILKAQKKMSVQGTMKITGANESIMEVFEITGFSDILNIE